MQGIIHGNVGFSAAVVPGKQGQSFVFHSFLSSRPAMVPTGYSSLRMIFPLVVLGRESRNSTILGYLYGAVLDLT